MEKVDLSVILRWDEESATMLYKAYYKALYSYARQLAGDAELAKDIVQEVFFRTWKQQNEFKSAGTLRAYLYNAVRNESLNHLEHRRIEQSGALKLKEKLHEMQTDENGETKLHKEEVYRLLFDAIDTLPEKQREIFLLAIKGKKNSEIAEAMNISLNTVKSQKKSGLEKLRNQLSPETLLFAMLLIQS